MKALLTSFDLLLVVAAFFIMVVGFCPTMVVVAQKETCRHHRQLAGSADRLDHPARHPEKTIGGERASDGILGRGHSPGRDHTRSIRVHHPPCACQPALSDTGSGRHRAVDRHPVPVGSAHGVPGSKWAHAHPFPHVIAAVDPFLRIYGRGGPFKRSCRPARLRGRRPWDGSFP